jgi:hypothetical protein
MLSLRALTPDGYMPGGKGSGLLFELCPSGMPAEIMLALAGDKHHHHHGHADGDSSSVSGTEQCPIGHMLASAAAVDTGVPPAILPEVALFDDTMAVVAYRSSATAYRSRAPPA